MLVSEEQLRRHWNVLNQSISWHARAHSRFRSAYQAISEIALHGSSLSDTVRSALFVSFVINYAAPFTSNRAAAGKYQYSTKRMRQYPDWDTGLHAELMELRDTLLAHIDGNMNAVTIGTQYFERDFEGVNYRYAVSRTAAANIISYPTEHGIVTKYQAHTLAAVEASQQLCAEELRKSMNIINENQEFQTEDTHTIKDLSNASSDGTFDLPVRRIELAAPKAKTLAPSHSLQYAEYRVMATDFGPFGFYKDGDLVEVERFTVEIRNNKTGEVMSLWQYIDSQRKNGDS